MNEISTHQKVVDSAFNAGSNTMPKHLIAVGASAIDIIIMIAGGSIDIISGGYRYMIVVTIAATAMSAVDIIIIIVVIMTMMMGAIVVDIIIVVTMLSVGRRRGRWWRRVIELGLIDSMLDVQSGGVEVSHPVTGILQARRKPVRVLARRWVGTSQWEMIIMS